MGANFSSEPVVEKHTERAQNDMITAAVSSCQGWRMTQEDEHSLMLELPGEHKASFFAVFDGHGSGRVSKHASEALWRHITQNESYIKGNFRQALEESFLSFDREVRDSYNAQLAGTTAICVLIVDNVIYCGNIGDSRAVASINCECLPLSQDHKPENPGELKRILAAGGYVLGNRVNGNLALSRAFGDFHYKSNEQLPAEQQIVCPVPDIKRIELNDDVDFIVLACDGIWDVLSSEEVIDFVISRLERNFEPGLICEQLTTKCIATDYELVIGCDNMTVLLICHTRGRSWEEYCTDIFEKNTKRLGLPRRTRTFSDSFRDQNPSTGGFNDTSSGQDVSERSAEAEHPSSLTEENSTTGAKDEEGRRVEKEEKEGEEATTGTIDEEPTIIDTKDEESASLETSDGNPASTDAPDEEAMITVTTVKEPIDSPTSAEDALSTDELDEGATITTVKEPINTLTSDEDPTGTDTPDEGTTFTVELVEEPESTESENDEGVSTDAVDQEAMSKDATDGGAADNDTKVEETASADTKNDEDTNTDTQNDNGGGS